jgi:hypothetical protein
MSQTNSDNKESVNNFWNWFVNVDQYDGTTIPILVTWKHNDNKRQKPIINILSGYLVIFLYFVIWWIPTRVVVAIIGSPYLIYMLLLQNQETALYILLGLIIFIGTIIQLVYYVPSPYPTQHKSSETSSVCVNQPNSFASTSLPTSTITTNQPPPSKNVSTSLSQTQETPQYTRDTISGLISDTFKLNQIYEKMYDSRNVDLRKSFYENISIQILEKWKVVLFMVYCLALLFYCFIIFASGNLTMFEKIKKILVALIVTNIYFIKFVIITVYWFYNYITSGTMVGYNQL